MFCMENMVKHPIHLGFGILVEFFAFPMDIFSKSAMLYSLAVHLHTLS